MLILKAMGRYFQVLKNSVKLVDISPGGRGGERRLLSVAFLPTEKMNGAVVK